MNRRYRSLVLAVAAIAVSSCGDDSGSTASVTETTEGAAITVEQLVERSADSPISVEGLLHATDGVVRLCAAILESYPPQCGEPSVELVGLDLGTIDGVITADAVRWKEGVVLTVQRQPDGRFAVVGT